MFATRDRCERSGVRGHRVLDPRAKTAARLRLAGGRSAEAASEDGPLRSETAPGPVADPADILADLPGGEA